MGTRQGVAVVQVHPGSGVEWLGRPTAFQMPLGRLLAPADLLDHAGVSPDVLDDHQVVIAVDAPLGFPVNLCRFLTGWPYGATDSTVSVSRPEREIDNPLAYRETDRHIHERFRLVHNGVVTRQPKKPLSPTFDKLGNNATVAIAHVRTWREHHGFVVRPMDDPGGHHPRIVIEVYPALVKEKRTGARGERVQSWFKDLMGEIPGGVEEPSDEFDAAICAVLGASYAARGSGLPRLVEPESVMPQGAVETVKREGWIY